MLKDTKIFFNFNADTRKRQLFKFSLGTIFFFSKFDPEKFLWAFYYFFQILKKVNHEKNFRGVKRFPGLLTFNQFYLISLRTPRAQSKAIKTEKIELIFGVSLGRIFSNPNTFEDLYNPSKISIDLLLQKSYLILLQTYLLLKRLRRIAKYLFTFEELYNPSKIAIDLFTFEELYIIAIDLLLLKRKTIFYYYEEIDFENVPSKVPIDLFTF